MSTHAQRLSKLFGASGELRVRPDENVGYTLPPSRGTPGQVVAQGSGGSGRQAEWKTPAFSVGVYFPMKPEAGQRILRVPMVHVVSFPAGLVGSLGSAAIAPTAAAVFSIQKNGVQIGTATFGASQASAVFSFASAVSFAVGDILSIVAPNPQDATLYDLSLVLVGTRTWS